MHSGIESGQTVILEGVLSGTIDLNGQDIASGATFFVDSATSSAEITDIDAVNTQITLANGSAKAFAGEITIAEVKSGGTVSVANAADLSGLLSVTGAMEGTINLTAGDLTGAILLGDDVSGDVINIANVVGHNGSTACSSQPYQGCLQIGGDLSGDVDITNQLEDANLRVLGGVASTGSVQIGSLAAAEGQITLVNLNENATGTFAGTLILDSGISERGRVFIGGNSSSTASIDLTGDDVAGELRLGESSAADILNGGDVTSTSVVELAHNNGNSYTGTAEFDRVAGGDAIIRTAAGADLDGDVDIAGEMDGRIEVAGALKSQGRITVEGLCDGDVTVAEDTASLSQIRLLGGLDSNGSVVINDGGGNFNANGRIHVGPATGSPPLPSVTFDGCILVEDNGSGG